MKKPIVFVVRCKPHGVDVIDIALDEKRVFIGYAMARTGAAYDPRNQQACVVDLACGPEEWAKAHATSDRNANYAKNRNLVEKVVKDSIAMIPRPKKGVVYCGYVKSAFQLVDAPPWYDRYVELHGKPDSDEWWHASQVAQCWQVDRFRAIPVPKFPAWIRSSFFGRSSYQQVHHDELMDDPYPVIAELMEERPSAGPRKLTIDTLEIERRMMCDLGPPALEHLIVSLLQLEHPDEVWTHVGGSGDGGVDGLGATPDGEVIGLLQCKWEYFRDPVFADVPVWLGSARKYLAALKYGGSARPSNCEFLDRPAMARLVAKHHTRLPQAVAMRIGTPG